MAEGKNKYKRMAIGIIVSFCFLLGVYIGGGVYYKDRFYLGSTINSVSVSGKTVEEADEILNDKLKEYSIVLEGREGTKGEIKSSDIGLKFNATDEVKALLEKQKSSSWISSVFKSNKEEDARMISFDKELLKEAVSNSIKSLNGDNLVEPQNVSFKYTESGYEVVDEIYGNKIDGEKLLVEVENAVLEGDTTLNLENMSCYVAPEYIKDSEKAAETLALLNKYVASSINYSGGKAVLNGETISTFLEVNNNLDVVINEKGVRGYVDKLSSIFNSIGKKRNFKTSVGKTVAVSGGNYGTTVDKAKETSEIIAAIKAGEKISKEPKYSQSAFSGDDIGNTYVEINFSRQQIWFYKNGNLIVNGNIVTGNLSAGHGTPTGIYRLAYKQRDTVLRGVGYASPVDFWMPFNGGIGIHDASWRSTFGGNIYKTNGSHGCINCPYNVAQAIYNNIESGTPIVCYYE